MSNLNRFTAFCGSVFMPVVGDKIYKKMRSKPIVPKEIKKFTELTSEKLEDVHIIAHRGLSGVNPENTAPSFEAAGSHGGYFGLECDTHMTTDGVWMILHDAELSTIYNGTGDVKTFSSEELLKLKVVRGANAEKYDDLKMCTLQEYIDICKKNNCHPIIEVKDPRPETMNSFYEMLKKNDILESAIVISFILDDLKALNKIDPKLKILYLVEYLTNKNIKDAKESGCIGMDFSSAFNACRPEYIKKVHDNGLLACCWTVDDKETLKSMLDAGVKYITSNCIIPE